MALEDWKVTKKFFSYFFSFLSYFSPIFSYCGHPVTDETFCRHRHNVWV